MAREPLGPLLRRLAFYCRCGSIFEMDVHESVVAAMERAWTKVHSGLGHGTTDAEGATLARLRASLVAGPLGVAFAAALEPPELGE